MGFEVALEARAERVLIGLPTWLQAPLEAHLFALGESPATLSRTVVSPPYPPGGMMSEFDHGPIDSTTHHFTIFFRYAQDETTLIVTSIGYYAW